MEIAKQKEAEAHKAEGKAKQEMASLGIRRVSYETMPHQVTSMPWSNISPWEDHLLGLY